MSMKYPGDTVSLLILRDGVYMNVTAPVWVPQRLVPRTLLQVYILYIYILK